MKAHQPHPGPTTRFPPKTDEAYRGYLIRTNALSNSMWIEKDGALIHRVPPQFSWVYARTMIDGLVGPPDQSKPYCGMEPVAQHTFLLNRRQVFDAHRLWSDSRDASLMRALTQTPADYTGRMEQKAFLGMTGREVYVASGRAFTDRCGTFAQEGDHRDYRIMREVMWHRDRANNYTHDLCAFSEGILGDK